MFDNYDKTLWLMLVGDEKGRNKIVSFIRDIPNECFEQVRQMINTCRETGELQSLHVVRIDNDGADRLCFDAHVFEDKELSLSISKFHVGDVSTDSSYFSLKLMPFDMVNYAFGGIPFKRNNFGETLEVRRRSIFDYDTMMDDCIFEVTNESKFAMFFSPVGYFVDVTKESFSELDNGPIKVTRGKKKKSFGIREIPDKLVLSNFVNIKSVDRLVRRKRKRKK